AGRLEGHGRLPRGEAQRGDHDARLKAIPDAQGAGQERSRHERTTAGDGVLGRPKAIARARGDGHEPKRRQVVGELEAKLRLAVRAHGVPGFEEQSGAKICPQPVAAVSALVALVAVVLRADVWGRLPAELREALARAQ